MTAGETRKVRGEAIASRERGAYFWLVMVLSVTLGFASNIFVTATLNARTERKFCAVVATVDDGYRKKPPTTDPGREQARIYANLRGQLGCPSPERK
jgi:hypothetical protein